MGSIVRVTCSTCSYEEEVYPGCGLLGACNDVMVCRDCKRVRTIAVTKGHVIMVDEPPDVLIDRCPACAGTNLVATSITEGIGPGATRDPCPVCDSGMLIIAEAAGIWD